MIKITVSPKYKNRRTFSVRITNSRLSWIFFVNKRAIFHMFPGSFLTKVWFKICEFLWISKFGVPLVVSQGTNRNLSHLLSPFLRYLNRWRLLLHRSRLRKTTIFFGQWHSDEWRFWLNYYLFQFVHPSKMLLAHSLDWACILLPLRVRSFRKMAIFPPSPETFRQSAKQPAKLLLR